MRTTDSGSATFEKIFTISVTNVNEAPTAVDDSYDGAIGNTLFTIGTWPSGPVVIGTGNVLTHNDSDPDGGPVSAVAETVSSTGGGTATINTDGSFTYMPGAGETSETDTFTYRLTDGTLESTGTVTITISRLIWYVDNAAPPGGDGRANAPFNSLAPLNGVGGMGDVDGGGDHIFLYQGSGSYTGGLRLEMGQSLIGQPFGLLVDGNSLVPPAGANPTITNSGDAAVTLADGVVVQRTNVSHT